MRALVSLAVLTCLLALPGCGHHYRAYRRTPVRVAQGAVPPTVVVGAETDGSGEVVVDASGSAGAEVVAVAPVVDDSPFVSSVVTAHGTPSASWSLGGGWASDAALVASTPSFAPPALAVPLLGGSVSATGDARGLIGLIGAGVRIDCALCSQHDAIAALSLLGPLSGGSLGADAAIVASPRVRLEASLAHDALPSSGGESAVVLRAIGGPAPEVPSPVRVHLVIDASTSMESRWDEVIASALALVGRLRAEDELQIVVYSTSARVALAPTRVGDGSAARAAIRHLRTGGRTNIEAGLRAAYGALVPSGGSIVLVLSDGVPQGGLATAVELGALAGEARARTGATTITIGLGNEFHPGVLRSIARRGGGDFRIAPSTRDLDALFAAELEAHAQIVARDVTLDVDLAPGVRVDASFDALGIDAAVTIDGGHVSVRIPALSAGEVRDVVLPIATDHAEAVASVSASVSIDGSTVRGDRELALGVSASPVAAGALLASLDEDLASALVTAASAVENGDASTASAALRAHAERARLSIAGAPPALEARIEHTFAFAAALDALVPGSGWGARRETAAAMLEWAGGL